MSFNIQQQAGESQEAVFGFMDHSSNTFYAFETQQQYF